MLCKSLSETPGGLCKHRNNSKFGLYFPLVSHKSPNFAFPQSHFLFSLSPLLAVGTNLNEHFEDVLASNFMFEYGEKNSQSTAEQEEIAFF
jgi:hypothetical protein